MSTYAYCIPYSHVLCFTVHCLWYDLKQYVPPSWLNHTSRTVYQWTQQSHGHDIYMHCLQGICQMVEICRLILIVSNCRCPKGWSTYPCQLADDPGLWLPFMATQAALNQPYSIMVGQLFIAIKPPLSSLLLDLDIFTSRSTTKSNGII